MCETCVMFIFSQVLSYISHVKYQTSISWEFTRIFQNSKLRSISRVYSIARILSYNIYYNTGATILYSAIHCDTVAIIFYRPLSFVSTHNIWWTFSVSVDTHWSGRVKRLKHCVPSFAFYLIIKYQYRVFGEVSLKNILLYSNVFMLSCTLMCCMLGGCMWGAKYKF